jgi:hypothetical protein
VLSNYEGVGSPDAGKLVKGLREARVGPNEESAVSGAFLAAGAGFKPATSGL